MSSGHFPSPSLSPLDTPLCLFHAYQRENTVFYRTLICPRDDIIPLLRSSSLSALQRGGPTEPIFPFMEDRRRTLLTAPPLAAFVILLHFVCRNSKTNCCRTSTRRRRGGGVVLAAALPANLTPADAEQMRCEIGQASAHPSLMARFI